MSTTSVGREAESSVADHLKKIGYKLVSQNWRTRWCEIDLVMSKNDVVYFIEVKYRKNALQGRGLEYVTPKKVRQMEFAANSWLAMNDWSGDARLLAVELSGLDDSFEMVELS